MADDEKASRQVPDGAPERCPWCSATTHAGATRCHACGAALAQRESIGDLVIPGVTDVDPNLRSTSLAGPFLRGQGTLSTLGAIGHIAPAAELAVAAAIIGQDYVKGLGREPVDPESVGRTSEAAAQAAERMDREGPAETDASSPGASPGGRDRGAHPADGPR